MDTRQDYYQLLHVLPDAPAPVIKASYRAMMQKLRHHPDLGGDPSLAQLLNLAADTLCDPERRARYDEQLRDMARRAAAQSAPAAAGTRPSSENAGGTPRPQAAERPGSHTTEDASRGSANKASHESHGSHESTDESSRESRASSSHDSPNRPTGDSGKAHYRQTNGQRQHTDEDRAATTFSSLPARPHCQFCGATRANATLGRQPYGATKYCLRCAAPSLPMEELPQSLSDELRRIYRHDVRDTVTLWTRWPKDIAITGNLQDLSLAGCAIGCAQALTGNAKVLLETSLLTAICQVRYCKPGNGGDTFQAGLEFLTLDIKARPGTVFSTVA